MIDAKPLRLRFNKADGFIRVYNGTRYLVWFGGGKYDAKSDITYVFSHNNAKLKIDLYDSYPLGKTLILHNVIILIESVFNKNQNHNYYNIFLEKCLNK